MPEEEVTIVEVFCAFQGAHILLYVHEGKATNQKNGYVHNTEIYASASY
jgi:hypothetical protein